jgi:hypothetical protein
MYLTSTQLCLTSTFETLPSTVQTTIDGSLGVPFSLPLYGQLLSGVCVDLSADSHLSSLAGMKSAMHCLMSMFVYAVNVDR